ncbi:uncharacterized protein G2W53_018737 [Senna tora]|uniref:Uncharacterized protein n=1 Tax=Senna tora TaxID=362788 RepID=A0A834TSY7_9FABA|nr:uncharacterized protein G2W53_018737 [Senna tora]
MEQNAAASNAAEKKDNNKQSRRSSRERGDEDHAVGIPIHTQVMKIKQETEKLKQPSLQQPDADMRVRRLLLRDISRHRSRSPLGLSSERTILVGNS